jgi:hypothetical protein
MYEWRSGRVADCNLEGHKSCPGGAAKFYFDSCVGKLTENCRKTYVRENKNRRKVPLRFEIIHLHSRKSSD